MSPEDTRRQLLEALAPLPSNDGGIAIVLATSGSPPALALLSSGDVKVTDDAVRAVTYRNSSAAQRLGDSFTLLVPTGDAALRVEVVDACRRSASYVELIEGRMAGIRPTSEPPWLLEMSFRPQSEGADKIPAFVTYWAGVREWLDGGAEGDPPAPAI